jgi:hypothetical protein
MIFFLLINRISSPKNVITLNWVGCKVTLMAAYLMFMKQMDLGRNIKLLPQLSILHLLEVMQIHAK